MAAFNFAFPLSQPLSVNRVILQLWVEQMERQDSGSSSSPIVTLFVMYGEPLHIWPL